MKMKATLALLSLLLVNNFTFANENGNVNVNVNEDCTVTLSLFDQAARIKNYTEAYTHLQELRKNCASFHLAIYQHGENIYKHRIENAQGAQKMQEFEEYKKLSRERLTHFPDSRKEGAMLADFAQVMFENQIGTAQEQFAAFEEAYNKDKESFTSPRSLYTYFSLAVDLHDDKKLDIKKVFELYDELIGKIESEEISLAARITPLIEKQDAGTALNQADERLLTAGETNLRAYSQVKGSIIGKLGILADCDNLIPMYNREFEENKSNIDWLQMAASRLSAKECEDPLFFKLVQELHNLNPSSRSAFYLGQLAEADGNSKMALDYYVQSAELETDNMRKARTFNNIAENYRKAGNFSSARTFYRRAIDANPSNGRAYLQIASMISQSANNCGTTVFERRAVNWLAADLARTAARVDPSVAANANAAANSYMERAPSRSDIFTEGMAGKTISFSSCWVGGSVTVPNL